jgi:aspartyl-tRNA(Asn)/glutamyl-tRNA(Gln) amidotransferase subunit B
MFMVKTGKYVLSIGMEVHAELLTQTKMFCRCPNAFGGKPNSRVCPVCLGHPGVLPVPNRKAIELVLKTAVALHCVIPPRSVFYRKNYYYPDLPKGYQISQYGLTNPIGYSGYLDVPTESGEKRVRIRRVHLEEDTGKLFHLPTGGSGVDFNRAGVPLMEIVTEHPPDLHTPEEAQAYAYFLRLVLLYLGVCDGKMEQGSFRVEPNISLAPEGESTLGIKTELKNLGSFKAVLLGIRHEAERMRQALDRGETLRQETRGWDEERQESYVMRVKEYEEDYRYFPDPDLPPLIFTPEGIEEIRASLPELPMAKLRRYKEEMGLSDYDARLLIEDPAWAGFFEEAVALGGEPKPICNWMNGDMTRLLHERSLTLAKCKVKPQHLVTLTQLIASGRISGKIAKEVFEKTFETGESPDVIVQREGKQQISDEAFLRKVVSEVLNQNGDAVEKYRAGKSGVLGFLVAQVMKKTQGQANPEVVNRLLKAELEK